MERTIELEKRQLKELKEFYQTKWTDISDIVSNSLKPIMDECVISQANFERLSDNEEMNAILSAEQATFEELSSIFKAEVEEIERVTLTLDDWAAKLITIQEKDRELVESVGMANFCRLADKKELEQIAYNEKTFWDEATQPITFTIIDLHERRAEVNDFVSAITEKSYNQMEL